jgi:hypothetical protein
MTIKSMQDRLNEVFKKRKRSKKVGIKIFIPAEVKEKMKLELQGDIYLRQSNAKRRIGK